MRLPPDSVSTMRQYVAPIVLKHLGTLNLHYNPITGRVNPLTRREYSDIKAIINDKQFFSTEQDFMDFLFKDQNGEFNEELGIKEWMYNLYIKIKDYSGANLNIKRAQSIIKRGSNYIDCSGWMDSPETFKISELKNAKLVFKAISDLFGHFTIRLVLFQMINPYGTVGNFGFDIMTSSPFQDIARYLEHFKIKSPIQTKRFLEDYIDHRVLSAHIFPLFFLDAYMFLPITSGFIQSEENTVSFGHCVAPYVDRSFSNPARNYRVFEHYIRDIFYQKYFAYYASDYAYEGTPQLNRKMFIDSGKQIVETLIPLIKDEVFTSGRFDKTLTKAQKTALYTSLITDLIQEVFESERYARHENYDREYLLRFQIENLLIGYTQKHLPSTVYPEHDQGNKGERTLFFHNVLVNGQPFTMTIEKEDFAGKDIKIWRRADAVYINSELAQDYNSQTTLKRVDVLKKIIGQFGGKVRIYPTIYKDIAHGFLYIKPGTQKTDGNYMQYAYLPRHAPPEKMAYFDIDISKEFDLKLLEYIVSMSYTYRKASAATGLDNHNFMFVMKGPSDGIDKTDIICAFDHRQFYALDEIHSVEYENPGYTSSPSFVQYFKITANSYKKDSNEHILDITSVNNDWSNAGHYLIISTEGLLRQRVLTSTQTPNYGTLVRQYQDFLNTP